MSSETNELVENYLILKPKEATFWKVFRFILPSGSKNIRNLIDCPDGKEESYTNFKARWTIFVSILLLKLLLTLATPLEILGKFCLKLMRARRTTVSSDAATSKTLSLASSPPHHHLRHRRSAVAISGTAASTTTIAASGVFYKEQESNSSGDLLRPEVNRDEDHEILDSKYNATNSHDSSDVRCKECEIMDLNYDVTNNFTPNLRCKDWEIMDLNDNTNLHGTHFKYYGALTILASKLAYSRASHVRAVVNGYWQMNLLGCYNFWNDFQKEHSTHAYMFQNTARDPNVTVLAFRGTDPFDANDWMVDFNISSYKIKSVGNIHSGFLQALGLQNSTKSPHDDHILPNTLNPTTNNNKPQPQHKFAYYTLRQKLTDILQSNPDAKFVVTGHSLGGALATLFVAMLALHHENAILDKLEAVYTYGQPRVGDKQFAEFMVNSVERYKFRYFRFVYSYDLVPRVPFDSILFKYKHFGGCVYYDCFFNGQFLRKPPSTNYFSIIWLIPKYFSAWWDLIRSLIFIPLFKGRAHFEGFSAIMLRCFGLLIPGLSAHTCPNYINSTRWGKIKNVPTRNERQVLARYIENKSFIYTIMFLILIGFVLFFCGSYWGWFSLPPRF